MLRQQQQQQQQQYQQQQQQQQQLKNEAGQATRNLKQILGLNAEHVSDLSKEQQQHLVPREHCHQPRQPRDEINCAAVDDYVRAAPSERAPRMLFNHRTGRLEAPSQSSQQSSHRAQQQAPRQQQRQGGGGAVRRP